MEIIPIAQVANQKISTRVNDNRYDLSLRFTGQQMVCSISRDGVELMSNQRVLPWVGLLPYAHLEDNIGNFYFMTNGDDIPDWNQFNVTQKLVFATTAEYQEIVNGITG